MCHEVQLVQYLGPGTIEIGKHTGLGIMSEIKSCFKSWDLRCGLTFSLINRTLLTSMLDVSKWVYKITIPGGLLVRFLGIFYAIFHCSCLVSWLDILKIPRLFFFFLQEPRRSCSKDKMRREQQKQKLIFGRSLICNAECFIYWYLSSWRCVSWKKETVQWI